MSERRVALALRVDEPFPHHQDILSGVFAYAREHPEWHCVVDEHPSYATTRRGENAQAYDGVIARASPELQRRLAKLGIPLVNTWMQHARPEVPGVYPDVAKIGRLAAGHLIERGFRSFAFAGAGGYLREDGIGKSFSSCAIEHGYPCVIDDIGNPDFGDRGEWLALKRHLKELLDSLPRPVGILVTVASVARLVMTMAHEHERRGVRNVGVICLDNVKTIVELSPQITSIDSNYSRIGHEAAHLLDQLMAGKKPAATMLSIPPKNMIPRESTDYFAVDDDLVAAALRYIAGRLRSPLGLDEIAKAIATSPRSLQRRFEAAMGCPVSDEIRRLRIDLARRLLGENNLTVDQISREAGFSSAVTMNHVFHREVGMSPSAYRTQVRGIY